MNGGVKEEDIGFALLTMWYIKKLSTLFSSIWGQMNIIYFRLSIRLFDEVAARISDELPSKCSENSHTTYGNGCSNIELHVNK